MSITLERVIPVKVQPNVSQRKWIEQQSKLKGMPMAAYLLSLVNADMYENNQSTYSLDHIFGKSLLIK